MAGLSKTEAAGMSGHPAVDRIQQHLAQYASALTFENLPPEVVHAAKLRFLDIMGVLIGGYFAEPCRMARELAARRQMPAGATIIGTHIKTSLDMAAFVNGATARYLEMNDAYHRPGVSGAHPSDMLPCILGVAEHARASGREFITAAVLAYEIYLRMNDAFHNMGFDHTNHCCLGNAVASGKLLGLSLPQLGHCIAMAVVPNVVVRQVRDAEHLSMFKAAATGQAGRSGIFAAMMARAGMEGPDMPFTGEAGWCRHVACEDLELEPFGGNGTPFKMLETMFKNRQSAGILISTILAAEKAAPLRNVAQVSKITVEVHERAKVSMGSGDHRWHPDTKESADHSVPYVAAAVLLDGTITLRSYDNTHLHSPQLHAIMQKTEVIENADFTQAFNAVPQKHCARLTLHMLNGETVVGATGGDDEDMASPTSDAQIEDKFRMLTEDVLGSARSQRILSRIQDLERVDNMADIPGLFAFD
jgi:2-methylcitrate dehydratase